MSKATFRAKTFAGRTFASGAWRGVGASIVSPVDDDTVFTCYGRSPLHSTPARLSTLTTLRDDVLQAATRGASLVCARGDLFTGEDR